MDDQNPTTTTRSKPKTIHLIRHGVARHNVPDSQTGERPNLHDPKYTDPSLIRQGELQARVLGEQLVRRGLVIRGGFPAGADAGHGSATADIRGGAGDGVNGDGMDVDDNASQQSNSNSSNASQQKEQIELVVCSPLSRCLQTASLVFPSYFKSNDKGADGNGNGNVMHVLDRECRVCCHGDVREAYGMHYPDKRSPLSQLKPNYPTVTYHNCITEQDDDWKPDTRESPQDVTQRIHKFFRWLLQQPHDNIAIVTHGVWMECALLEYCPEVLDFGKERVYNCDVYCGKLLLLDDDNRGDNDGGGVALQSVEQMSFYHA